MWEQVKIIVKSVKDELVINKDHQGIKAIK